MLLVLTPEEEIAQRRKSYEQLGAGKLFDLGGKRYFVTVEKFENSVKVIELNPENIERMLRGELCLHSTLNFDDMGCLNVRSTEK